MKIEKKNGKTEIIMKQIYMNRKKKKLTKWNEKDRDTDRQKKKIIRKKIYTNQKLRVISDVMNRWSLCNEAYEGSQRKVF